MLFVTECDHLLHFSKVTSRSYFQLPAWWPGPTLARAFHTSPDEMPTRHSELEAPPPASQMTSVACKTPEWEAEWRIKRGQQAVKNQQDEFNGKYI